jgi:hypothetical protein
MRYATDQCQIRSQYGPGVVKEPSRTTQYRRLGEEDHRTPTWTGSRARNRDIQSREDREYGKLIPSRPGEYIVMDTYCLDVFALDPVTLKWVSVEVTVAMDVADHSRYPRLLTQLVGVRVNATILGCSRTLPSDC